MLRRMAMIVDPEQPRPEISPEVEYATEEDAARLSEIYEAQFDRYAEQIPTAEEVREAVKRGSFLVIRRDGDIAGFFYFPRTGLTAYAHCWYVDSRFRGQQIGSKLFRGYLAATWGVRLLRHWIVAINGESIVRHRHYGFEFDGLVDQVMTNWVEDHGKTTDNT